MKKSFELIKQEFESSSMKTPQYLAFHRTFKREFTKLLQSLGAENVEVKKANHFDVFGFFTIANQIWYFSIGDLRWDKNTMLIRTAKNYVDYTGGSNQTVSLKDEKTFTTDLKYIVKVHKVVDLSIRI